MLEGRCAAIASNESNPGLAFSISPLSIEATELVSSSEANKDWSGKVGGG